MDKQGRKFWRKFRFEGFYYKWLDNFKFLLIDRVLLPVIENYNEWDYTIKYGDKPLNNANFWEYLDFFAPSNPNCEDFFQWYDLNIWEYYYDE